MQRLVLSPIERMVDLVERVSKHPLAKKDDDMSAAKGTYETRLLESTLDKITSLLRVGFGEAGSGIISSNLGTEDTSYSSVIKALIPGIRVYAIVGFCDIHHFEDVEDRLKKDILTFVNSIAEIVHSSVQHWGGQCNKNLGNAFVVIWRIGDEETLMTLTNARTKNSEPNKGNSLRLRSSGGRLNAVDNITSRNSDYDSSDSLRFAAGRKKKVGNVLDLKKVPGIDEIADRALIAYLKIIAEINRNKQVLAFRSDPRLTREDSEQYKVRMGFGLHVGWAIEGTYPRILKI